MSTGETLGVVAIIIFLIILPFALFLPGFGMPNSGSHVGYVTAIEKSGVFWKTYTAYVKTELESSQEDMYCVKDMDVVNDLQIAARNKIAVELSYERGLTEPLWDCDAEQSVIVQVNAIGD